MKMFLSRFLKTKFLFLLLLAFIPFNFVVGFQGGGGVTTLMYTPSTISGSVGSSITPASPMAGTTGGATSYTAPMLSTYGLSIDPTSGMISGTPTIAASSVTITIEGYTGATMVSQGTITLNITSGGGGGGTQTLSYTNSPYMIIVGNTVSITDISTTVIAPSYSSADIPSWLSIIPSTGAIFSNGVVQSGTKSTTFTVVASGSNGSATTDITIDVFENGKKNHQLGNFIFSNKTYGDAPFTITAPSSESDGVFTFQSDNSSVISISGNTATVVGAGTATITALQAEGSSHNASSISTTITVQKATLTVTAESKSKVYGTANPTFTSVITGFVYGQDLSTSGVTGSPSVTTAATTSTSIGNYAITPSIGSLASNNYDFTFADGQLQITPADLTITGITANNRAYNGALNATVSGTPTLVGVVGSDDVQLTGTPLYTFASKDVADGIVITTSGFTLSGTTSSNYNLIQPTLSANITPLQLSVGVPVVTLSKVYDGNTSASVTSGTLTGVLSGETVTVSAVANYADKNVGTGKTITVIYTLGGTDAGNYAAPTTDASINTGEITALQLSVTSPTITKVKMVDGNTSAQVVKGQLQGVLNGDIVEVNATAYYDNPFIGVNKKITVSYSLSGLDKDNYIAPVEFVVNDGQIKDIPPSNLKYTPETQISSLGTAISKMLPTADGGKIISYTIQPGLPGGLSLDQFSGEVSGTRTESLTGLVIYTITAENSGGNTTVQISINYNTPPSNVALSKTEIYEGNNIGAEIGVLTTTDIDLNEIHTYELVNGAGSEDNNLFIISGNKLLAAKQFNYQEKNTYSIRIRVKDKAGLIFEKTMLVRVLELPKVLGTNSSQYNGGLSDKPTISLGFGSQLQIQGQDIVAVSWSPSIGLSSTTSLNPIAKPNVTTTYTVIITHKSGSKTELKITVEVKNDYAIEPATILTPNGDGINDFWVVKNLEVYANNEVSIYDRSGRLLYTMKNYNNRWDGKINGRPLATGTYYYIIRFSQQPGIIFKGFITIALN